MGINGKLDQDIGVCDTCEVGKHTRASFQSNESKVRSAKKPLEIVHMDLIGPIDTPSLSGARYGLLFTDDVTRWRRIYFLKEKSDALEKLMLYEGDMSALLNDRDIKIARLHSDNGGEFVGAKFKSYCSGKAILLNYEWTGMPGAERISPRGQIELW